MPDPGIPTIDLVLLTCRPGPLQPEVEHGLHAQQEVQLQFHRVVGSTRPNDSCRYETIARARNEGKLCGSAWLIFVDDDVVLEPRCTATLAAELSRRPVFAALGADYLGEHRNWKIAPHVSMGATLFRRAALDEIRFRWEEKRCECQCCCDDLRRSRWGIDYCQAPRRGIFPRGNFVHSRRNASIRIALL